MSTLKTVPPPPNTGKGPCILRQHASKNLRGFVLDHIQSVVSCRYLKGGEVFF